MRACVVYGCACRHNHQSIRFEFSFRNGIQTNGCRRKTLTYQRRLSQLKWPNKIPNFRRNKTREWQWKRAHDTCCCTRLSTKFYSIFNANNNNCNQYLVHVRWLCAIIHSFYLLNFPVFFVGFFFAPSFVWNDEDLVVCITVTSDNCWQMMYAHPELSWFKHSMIPYCLLCWLYCGYVALNNVSRTWISLNECWRHMAHRSYSHSIMDQWRIYREWNRHSNFYDIYLWRQLRRQTVGGTFAICIQNVVRYVAHSAATATSLSIGHSLFSTVITNTTNSIIYKIQTRIIRICPPAT